MSLTRPSYRSTSSAPALPASCRMRPLRSSTSCGAMLRRPPDRRKQDQTQAWLHARVHVTGTADVHPILWRKLIAARCHEQVSFGVEKEARRQDLARPPELDGANLLAVRVEHVRERNQKGHPQIAVAVDSRRSYRWHHERELLAVNGPTRPDLRHLLDHRIELSSLHDALEHQRAVCVVALEERHACEKDEEVSTIGERHRHAGIHREMQLAVAFVSGGAQPPDTAKRCAGESILRDERAGLGLAERDGFAEERERAHPVQREA